MRAASGDLTSGAELSQTETADIQSLIGSMAPEDMGRRVVEGIRDNRLYILTHPEFLAEMRERHRAIEEAFDAEEVAPAARTRFEQTRRETVDRLFGMTPSD